MCAGLMIHTWPLSTGEAETGDCTFLMKQDYKANPRLPGIYWDQVAKKETDTETSAILGYTETKLQKKEIDTETSAILN